MLRSLFFRASRKQSDSRVSSLSCAVLHQKNCRAVENDRENRVARPRGVVRRYASRARRNCLTSVTCKLSTPLGPLEQRKDCDEQTQENSDQIEPKANCFSATLFLFSNSLTQFSLTFLGQVDVGSIL